LRERKENERTKERKGGKDERGREKTNERKKRRMKTSPSLIHISGYATGYLL